MDAIRSWFVDGEARSKRAILDNCPESIEGASPAANAMLQRMREAVQAALAGRDREIPRRMAATLVGVSCAAIAIGTLCGGASFLVTAIAIVGVALSALFLRWSFVNAMRCFPLDEADSTMVRAHYGHTVTMMTSVSCLENLFRQTRIWCYEDVGDDEVLPLPLDKRQKNLDVLGHIARLTGYLSLDSFEVYPDAQEETSSEHRPFVRSQSPTLLLSEAKKLVDSCDGAIVTISTLTASAEDVELKERQQLLDSYLTQKGFLGQTGSNWTRWSRV